MTNLTYQQKVLLRQKFGLLESIERSDYDTNDEYLKDKEQTKDELHTMCKEMGLTNDEISNLPLHIYSKNQLQFIEDCEDARGDLHFDYSGRGMFGDCCPALYCESHNDITTTAKTVIDNMGLGIVIYAKN